MGPAGLQTPLSVEGTVSPLGTQSSQTPRSSAFPGRRFKMYNYIVKALRSPAHRTCLNGRLQHCPVLQGTPVNMSQDGCLSTGGGRVWNQTGLGSNLAPLRTLDVLSSPPHQVPPVTGEQRDPSPGVAEDETRQHPENASTCSQSVLPERCLLFSVYFVFL